MSHTNIIVSLDLSTAREALSLVDRLGDEASFYKIGPILFCESGPAIVKKLKEMGKKVFLDLKFHDIPNTVEKACLQASEMGVDLLTIHLSGGKKMISAALKGTKGYETKVLGVSVLTSMNPQDLEETGIQTTLESQVHHLIGMGLECQIPGIVCSAMEIEDLRKSFGHAFIAVTPGIRLPEDKSGDQTRVMTPKAAMDLGASYLVVGRPVYASANPLQRFQAFKNAMRPN